MIVVTHTAIVQVLIHIEWVVGPLIWAGLVTLAVIKLVLDIDNLVFIAILAEKPPPAQHDHAHITGLLLAIVMCPLLLASISWLVTLTRPLIVSHDFSFSARNLIILFGGLFLLFKATAEFNKRLEGKDSDNPTQRGRAKLRAVVVQIAVLNVIFSLGSVITAVGMVGHLAVMMAVMIIAISPMLMASRALIRFVNSHSTIVILRLNFLLVIDLSLTAEGLSFVIPKDYLHAAIGFSVMIKALSQLVLFNHRRSLSANMTLCQRATEAVMSLLNDQKEKAELDANTASLVANQDYHPLFNPQERLMTERVLNFNQRSVSSIMTSRRDIEYISLSAPEEETYSLVGKDQHIRLMMTGGKDSKDLPGVTHVTDLLQRSLRQEPLDLQMLARQPLVFPEGLPLLSALEQSRQARTHSAFAVDEFGSVEGIMTLSNMIETIAGNLSSEAGEIDAQHGIQHHQDGSWTVNGHMPLEDLVQHVPLPLDDKREYHTVTGLLMEYLQYTLQVGETIEIDGYTLCTLQADSHRVQKV